METKCREYTLLWFTLAESSYFQAASVIAVMAKNEMPNENK